MYKLFFEEKKPKINNDDFYCLIDNYVYPLTPIHGDIFMKGYTIVKKCPMYKKQTPIHATYYGKKVKVYNWSEEEKAEHQKNELLKVVKVELEDKKPASKRRLV